MPPPAETPDHDDPTLDDLVVPLLHAAMQAGHAADKLRSLAALDPGAAASAHRQVHQAIATMTDVRRTLIRAAEELHRDDPTDR